MYKLVFIIVVGILLYLAYGHYQSLQQQQLELDAKSNNYELGKKALEEARTTKSPQPLNDFIQQNPQSDWLETAIYYRDKYAVQQIVESRDTRKLKDFISKNPKSEWVPSAQQHLIKIQREQENKEIQQRVLNNRSLQDIPKGKENAIPALKTPTTPNVEKAVQTQPKRKPNRNDSAERVKRALSIYQKMNKPNIAREEERKNQQQEEAKRLKACNSLKDQLRQFQNSRRTRWYELDNSGKRVFMSKQAVAQQKKAIKSQIEEHCP